MGILTFREFLELELTEAKTQLHEDSRGDKNIIREIEVNSFNEFLQAFKGITHEEVDKNYSDKILIIRKDIGSVGGVTVDTLVSKLSVFPVLIYENGYIQNWSYERSTKLGTGVMVDSWDTIEKYSKNPRNQQNPNYLKDEEKKLEKSLKVVWNRIPRLHKFVQNRNS